MIYLFGRIVNFTSISSFVVDNRTVDASAAVLTPTGTSASDLVVGTVVAVEGTLANGIVTASTVMLVQ